MKSGYQRDIRDVPKSRSTTAKPPVKTRTVTSRRRQSLGLAPSIIEDEVEKPTPPRRHHRIAFAILLVCGAILALALILWRPGHSGDAVAEIAPVTLKAGLLPQPLAVVRTAPPARDLPLFVPDRLPEALPKALPKSGVHEAAWQKNAVKVAFAASAPKLAIILDDMGLDRPAVKRAAQIKGPLTFSFLPYAHYLPRLTRYVRAHGHELMVHMPMEPLSTSMDPGPHALLVDLSKAELEKRIAWNLSRFKGFVGLNNHMGSRFTEDTAAMRLVLAQVKERGLLFVDSRTTDATVGDRMAAAMHIPHRARDVFLDNIRTRRAIRIQLRKAVEIARKYGSAIAIGHPHDQTLAVLERDLPRYTARGVVLVPVSALMTTTPLTVHMVADKSSTATP